jgi:rRNA-processing protein FCF1
MPLSALDEHTIAVLIQEAIDRVPNALTIFDENFVPIVANKVSRELYGVLHAAMESGKTYREATFLSIKAADATRSKCPIAAAGFFAPPIRR